VFKCIQNFGFWGEEFPLFKSSLKRIKILGIFGQSYFAFKIRFDLFSRFGFKSFFFFFPFFFFFYFF
jgi:hypothetical protein